MRSDGKSSESVESQSVTPEDIFYQAEFFEHASRVLGNHQGIETRIMGGEVESVLPPQRKPAKLGRITVIDQGIEIDSHSATGMQNWPPSIIPLMVNSFFCVELYLKSLVVLETGSPTYGHDLDTLFQKLKGETRGSIEELYNAEREPACTCSHHASGSDNKDLAEVLKWHAKAFVQMRYCYELQGWHFHPLLPVQKALREYIKRSKPEWVAEFRRRGIDRLQPTGWIELPNLR